MLMTEDTMREVAPAVFTDFHRMSENYRQVQTIEVVRRLADAGYYPVDAGQDRPSKRNPALVTHKVVLRHETHIERAVPNTPQILIINSHNGRRKLNMLGGIYRLVCTNGLVIGENLMRFQARHSGNVLDDAMQFARMLGERLPEIDHTIERWSQKELTDGRAATFAREASNLRWGEKNPYEPEALLEPRRDEDRKRDLWTIFNVVQENCSTGGVQGRNANNRPVRSGALTQIERNAQFNRELWDLAEQFA